MPSTSFLECSWFLVLVWSRWFTRCDTHERLILLCIITMGRFPLLPPHHSYDGTLCGTCPLKSRWCPAPPWFLQPAGVPIPLYQLVVGWMDRNMIERASARCPSVLCSVCTICHTTAAPLPLLLPVPHCVEPSTITPPPFPGPLPCNRNQPHQPMFCARWRQVPMSVGERKNVRPPVVNVA